MLRSPKFWSLATLTLALLLLVADRGAQFALERVVAGQVKDALSTPSKPSVDLGGFPILQELVAQKLDQVEVDIRDGDAGKVRLDRVHAVLRGVKQDGGGVQVDSITGDGLVGYDALSQAAKPLTVGYGGDGLVEVTARVQVGGADTSVKAAGRPRIEGNQLLIKPERVSAGAGGADARVPVQVPEVRIELRDIPPGLKIALNPAEAGIEFTLDGTNVFLASADSTALGPIPAGPDETAVSFAETRFTRPRTAA